ncbi:MAG TPA: methionyl-tRNA formyltransferase [Coriobacteriia bacterium]
MRVVFLGTPQFSVASLAALTEAHDVVAVYTRPDRPSGRGKKTHPSAVKSAALELGLPLRQPARLGEPEEVAALAALAPHCIVVAAYGAILPLSVLEVPMHGCVNVHASLLPRWRGAAPIQRAILAGDVETGVSIMRMEVGLDTGPWCSQGRVPIAGKNAADLAEELAVLGAGLLIDALPGLADGSLTWHGQDGDQATYAAKLTAADVELDPALSLREALARVRASGGSAPCRVLLDGRKLTVLDAAAGESAVPAGRILAAKHLELGCADGSIRLMSVVPEGRSAMSGEDFLRGARLGPDVVWSKP